MADLQKGVFVAMEGVIEVRWTSEDPAFYREPEDLMVFQERIR